MFGKAAQEATRRTAVKITRDGADRFEELARMNTPVRTGKLRSAWHQLPMVEIDVLIAKGYRVTIANDVEYAQWVESGTGLYGPEHRPYVIVPKDPQGTLAWRDPKSGRMVFAKKVMHPGSPGNHMLAIAAHVVEFEVESGVIGRAALEEWAREIDGLAD